MYRFIEGKLKAWKQKTGRKPLIIRGARQVGKTYSVLQFGKKHFPGKVHHLDLEKRTDLHSIFEINLDVKRIVADLEIALNTRINPGSDLLFLDEIQSCPRALMALRYFYEEMNELHVIAAGSLLEFALENYSFPVGRLQFLEMHPMSFVEFLIANGNSTAVRQIFGDMRGISESTHRLLLDWVRKYMFVGGMPECVKTFVQEGKLVDVFDVQKNLMASYLEDFAKYGNHVDRQCLHTVLLNTSRSVGNQIIYTRLADSFTGPTNKKAFDILSRAKIIEPVYAVHSAKLPLGASMAARKIKPLFLDVGLMQQMAGVNVSEEYYKADLMRLYRGKLAEQFVGQELIAYGARNVFFWARNAKSSTAEVDYIVELKEKVLPIEVKSGPSGKLKSLHLLLNEFPGVPHGLVFSTALPGEISEQRIQFLPLYAVSRLFNMTMPEI